MTTIQQEVDQNYEVFMRELPVIINQHRGQFALMRGGEIITYFTTPVDARAAGDKLFPDGLYSIQQVTDAPADLGFFSYAVPVIPVQP